MFNLFGKNKKIYEKYASMGFRMWDETVIFLDGWFVLIDSKLCCIT